MSFGLPSIAYMRKIVTLFFVLVLLGSCEVFDPQKEVPAYVYIPSFDVELEDPLVQGTAEHNFSDVWITVDQEPLGAFKLPALIPVGQEGEGGIHELSLRPGIKLNGINATRLEYGPMRPDVLEVDLKTLETDTLIPTARYYETEVFPWVEDFENPGFSLEAKDDSDTGLYRTTQDSLVFEGAGSAYFTVDSDRPFFECISTSNYEFPKINNPVFLEIHYKAEVPFVVGVYANGPSVSQQAIVTVNKKDVWNKIYVNVTPHVVSLVNGNVKDFTFFIGTLLDVNQHGPGPHTVYLDNIKLVY